MNTIVKRVGILMLLTMAVATTAMAQGSSDYPRWVFDPPQSMSSTTEIKVFQFRGVSFKKAQIELAREVSRYLGEEWGFQGTGSMVTMTTVENSGTQKEYYYHGENVCFTVNNQNVSFRIIDKYSRDSNNHYFLCAVPRSLNVEPLYDRYMVTSNYGVDAAWRSAIVPGWGQMYKGQYAKGGVVMGGSVLLIGGIIYTEYSRKGYAKLVTQTHNTEHMREYQSRRNGFATARNICIGALGALYVYNLVDAVVADGPRYVKVKADVKDRYGNSYAFMPSISADGVPMLAASITF